MTAHAANASGRVGPKFDVAVRRVNETVVAVVAGPRAFVSGTAFAVADGAVAVTPPRSNATVEAGASAPTLGGPWTGHRQSVATSTPASASAARTWGTSQSRTSRASSRGSNPWASVVARARNDGGSRSSATAAVAGSAAAA